MRAHCYYVTCTFLGTGIGRKGRRAGCCRDLSTTGKMDNSRGPGGSIRWMCCVQSFPATSSRLLCRIPFLHTVLLFVHKMFRSWYSIAVIAVVAMIHSPTHKGVHCLQDWCLLAIITMPWLLLLFRLYALTPSRPYALRYNVLALADQFWNREAMASAISQA